MPKKIIQDIITNPVGSKKSQAFAGSEKRKNFFSGMKKKGEFNTSPRPPRPQREHGEAGGPKRKPVNLPPGAERVEPPKRVKEFSVKPRKEKKVAAKAVFWTVSVVLFVFAAGFVVDFFSSAVIKITPQQEFVPINTDFKAIMGSERSVLPFEVMRLKRTEKYRVKSGGLEKISERASGRIAIYNAYKSKSQLLVSGTRFESPDGKIYRIKQSVTVPGAEIKNGEIVPSSIEVMVYADEPGEGYNIGLVDFSIPGFRGGPRYEKFYARSKTEMTGGFEGIVPVVTAEDISGAKDVLSAGIKERIQAEAARQKPDKFLLYPGALAVAFSEPDGNPKVANRKKYFEYEMTGDLTGFLIKKTDLVERLAKRYLKDKFSGAGIANVEDLEFTMLDRGKDDKNITFKLKGTAHFVWSADTESLLDKLRKAKKSEYNSVFMSYPFVDEAEIIFSPSWWRKLPGNDSRVQFEQILKSG